MGRGGQKWAETAHLEKSRKRHDNVLIPYSILRLEE